MQERMSAEERRAAIVQAVLPLFAREGFASATTRKLAAAAGVSEALLYKHFPSKESLYAEIQNVGCSGNDSELERLSSLEPSTETLVQVIYYVMQMMISGQDGEAICWETRHRMVLHSCLEDGSFTRFLFRNRFAECVTKVEACIDAAKASGDLVDTPVPKRNLLLFTHHLATMVAAMYLPEQPVVDYKASRSEVLRQAVWYALRGLGLKDETIVRYYHPDALERVFGEHLAES